MGVQRIFILWQMAFSARMTSAWRARRSLPNHARSPHRCSVRRLQVSRVKHGLVVEVQTCEDFWRSALSATSNVNWLLLLCWKNCESCEDYVMVDVWRTLWCQ